MNQIEYIGKQIRHYRKAKGWSASELGKMVKPEKTESAITSWERGRTQPDGDMLIQLCILFGVDISDFYYKPAEYHYAVVSLNEDESEDGYVDVPIYGEIAAGTPIEMLEIDDTFPIPIAIRNAHQRSGLLRVNGNSWNKQIPHGYLALIDFDQKEPTNDKDPFAVCVNGYSATIKAVEFLENGLKLKPNSYDPTCIPIVYDYNKDDTEEVTIIGKVVWATMPFDYDI